MTCSVLPASPNWYCSRVSDCNGEGVFAYGARGNIFVYDIRSNPPTFIGNFPAHSDKVSSFSINKITTEQSLCCSTGDDGKVKIWDLRNNFTLVKEYHHSKGKFTVTEWSPTLNGVVTCGDDKGNVLSWDHTINDLKHFKPENGVIFCLAHSQHQSGLVALGYKTGLILIIDVNRDGAILHRLRGHEDEVHCICWCPLTEDEWFKFTENKDYANGGQLLASGGRDRTIRLWSTSKSRCLQVLKIPTNTGQRRPRYDDGGRTRIWLTLAWLKDNPCHMISSSNSGELLLWDLSKDCKQKWQTFNAHKTHSRIVFNICVGGPTQDVICTISMDRRVGVWSLESLSCQHLIPTLGGFAYCVSASSLHPDKLAVGVGDDMIRIWDVGSQQQPYEADVMWQGIRGKVTCLSWHPVTENLLAYGTDDGKVGVYDVASSKPPLISSTYHKKTVYVVTWGPQLSETVANYHVVYSCGDGNILMHNLKKMDKEAKNFQDLLPDKDKNNGKIRSEVCWKPDFSAVAIGNSDGSVEVYSRTDLTLVCIIQVHKKLINCLRWHPQYTVAHSNQSANHCWLAIGSNELTVDVVDLEQVLGKSTKADQDTVADHKTVVIMNSFISLEAHHNRVTCLSWSPHIDGQLVSASYDGTVEVWDVINKKPVANYRGHRGRVLGVQWSLKDPDLVYSAGDDFTVRSWKISQQEHTLPKKEKHKKSRGQSKGKRPPPETTVASPIKPDVAVSEEMEELRRILEEKKRELLMKESQTPGVQLSSPMMHPDSPSTGVEESIRQESEEILPSDRSSLVAGILGFDPQQYNNAQPASTPEPEMSSRSVDTRKTGKARKRKDWKSLFPVTGTLENQGKVQSHKDMETLAAIIYENIECPTAAVHLGLFTDRKAAYSLFQAEIDHHISHGHLEGAIYLELWKGNIGGAVTIATENKCLSDWLVGMAAQACHCSYVELCSEYAVQLESDSQFHKAASYLLACHKVYEAIDLLKRNHLYREAVAIARIRLHHEDPLLQELYLSWGGHLVKDGGYEQAAKCFVAAKKPLEAAKLLSRRGDQSGLKAAIFVCLSSSERQEARRLALTFCLERLVKMEFDTCELWDILQSKFEELDLKYFDLVVKMHHFLAAELKKRMNLIQQSTGLCASDYLLNTLGINNSSISKESTFLESVYMVYEVSQLLSDQDTPQRLEAALAEISSYKIVHQGSLEIGQLLVHVSFDLVLGMLKMALSHPNSLSHFVNVCDACYKAAEHEVLSVLCSCCFPKGAYNSLNYLHKFLNTRQGIHHTVLITQPHETESVNDTHSINLDFQQISAMDSLHAYTCWCKLLTMKKLYSKEQGSAEKQSHECPLQELLRCSRSLLSDAVAKQNYRNFTNTASTVHLKSQTDVDTVDCEINGENSGRELAASENFIFPDPVECARVIVELCDIYQDNVPDTDSELPKVRQSIIDWALKYAYKGDHVTFFKQKISSCHTDESSVQDSAT